MDINTVLKMGSNLITVVGFPILIYTLYLLIKQLRIQAYQSVYQSSIIWDKYSAEHPMIRPYIYDGKPMPMPKDDPFEFYKVIGSVEMLWAFFEHVAAQMPHMSEGKREGWENHIREVYETSPAMRYYVEKYKKWHSSELLNLVHKRKEAKNRLIKTCRDMLKKIQSLIRRMRA